VRTLLLALLFTLAPHAYADELRLPDMGASAQGVVSAAEEERLGREFMRNVRRALPVMDAPLLQEYIQDLGTRIAPYAHPAGRRFHFFLIDQPVVNAFAGPGGYIGVYTGLVLATESEDELASVLAHEIAHVTQQHLLRSIEDAKRMSGPMAALLLAAVILGASVSSNLGVAAALGAQAASAQHQINFTRANEKEADSLGIQALAAAGFDPTAMAVFFQRLARNSRLYANNAPEFLRTHPVSSNRIADALGRAARYPHPRPHDQSTYFLVRATLRERGFERPGDAERFFAEALKSGRYRNREAWTYGLALAQLRAHHAQAARHTLVPLLKKEPTSLFFILLAARVERALGRNEAARRGLEAALTLFPGDYPLSRPLSEWLLADGHPERAEEILKQALERRPDAPDLHRLLAEALGRRGRVAEAHLHLAEAFALQGQLEPAIHHLQQGLREPGLDNYLGARLQARLRALRKTEKALRRH